MPEKQDLKAVREAQKELVKALVATTSQELPQYVLQRAKAAGHARQAGLTKVHSLSNQLFLAGQVRRHKLQHLGVYAGPEQYAKIGRTVKDGAKALLVYAPVIKEDEDTGRDRIVAWFTVEVFDYTDTVADDPDFVEPDFEAPLFVGNDATLSALVESSPVPVTFVQSGATLERSSISESGIVVDASAPVGTQISSLVHQVCHARLCDTRHPSSPENEELCVLAQYLFMEMSGLGHAVGNDVAAQAVDNLRRWVDPKTGEEIAGHKLRMKLLNQRLKSGFDLVNDLVNALEIAPVPALV